MAKSKFRADGGDRRVSETSLDAFRLARTGKTYDLSSGWWPGMPILPAHPPFQLMTYRSPPGVRNQRDLGFLVEDNQVNLSFVSEMLMCTTHSGTHIDALAHITCGPENCWHGGFSANTHLGDFGPLNKDASELPPLIKRGVMIDVPGALGVPHLAPHQPIRRAELQQALARQGCEVKADDVVLVRTGMMMDWPDAQRMEASAGAGLDLDGAEWLVERGVCAVGGDTVALEVVPSGRPGDPQPVHRYLIQEQGVLIMEWVFMEDLARDGVYEFLFICLPLSIKGATGSLIRPLAIG
jgi:kynurenine formamidase